MGAATPNIDEIFFAALERKNPEARAAYVDEVCGSDPDLRERVERLLDAQSKVGDFLESPAAGPTVTLGANPVLEGPGTVIGVYKLLEQIGEGGMGVVYMAEQIQPVRRKVALKIIKPGMDTKQVIARFEAERQALAMMDHPNISRVLDAGATDSGRPYFVMELVRGIPITEYCDNHRLSINDRLDLFVSVCQAVQHAHQKGIIHRDIKPSNVLITLHDGVPVPKVIDFGIAKATGQSLTDKTLFTGFAQLIGTPLYMSPEQAELSGIDIDTRSDVYSLGVLMYELLTGTTPFDRETFCTAAIDEVRRIIREHEPPTPSTRFSSLGATETSVSANRGTDPRKLNRSLRGELDWIAMKALEKDRRRRYETASSFAADVVRYRNDQPVEAGPPSAWYRLRKSVRRNRVTLAMTTSIVGVVVVALTVSNILISREQRRTAANLQLARQAIEEYLTKVSESRLLNEPGLQPLRKELLESALKYYQALVGKHAGDRGLRQDLGQAYMRVGAIKDLLGEPAKALDAYQSALEIFKGLAAKAPNDREAELALSSAYNNVGNQYGTMGDAATARQYLEQSIVIGEQTALGAPRDEGVLGGLANHYVNLGIAQEQTGALRIAERSYRQAVAIRERLVALRPDDVELRRYLAQTHVALGQLLRSTGRLSEAKTFLLNVIKSYETALAAHPESTIHRYLLAGGLMELGSLQHDSGDPREARRSWWRSVDLFESLVASNASVVDYRRNLAGVLQNLEYPDPRYTNDECEKSFRAGRRAEELLLRLIEDEPRLPDYRYMLVSCYGNEVGHYGAHRKWDEMLACSAKASELGEPLIATREGLLRTARPLSHAYLEAAEHQIGRGEKATARRLYERCRDLLERLIAETPNVPSVRDSLGITLFRLSMFDLESGHLEEAERKSRRQLALARENIESNPDLVLLPPHMTRLARFGSSHRDLANILMAQRRATEAVSLYDEAISILEDVIRRQPVDHFAPIWLAEIRRARADALMPNGTGAFAR